MRELKKMNRSTDWWKRSGGWAGVGSVVWLLLVASQAGLTWGQQAAKPPAAGVASEPAAADATAPSPVPANGAAANKQRLRLPTYFSGVVTPKQRDEIYRLQQEFADKIAALQMQIETLMVEREQALDGVLQPDQLAAVNKKREEAKQRRAARAAPTATEATEAESP